MLQSAVLSLAFYHHPLLDALKQSHPAYATFTGLCRNLELPGHHLLLTAAWSSQYLLMVEDMKDRAPQYCRLALRVHITQFRFQLGNQMGFPVLETVSELTLAFLLWRLHEWRHSSSFRLKENQPQCQQGWRQELIVTPSPAVRPCTEHSMALLLQRDMGTLVCWAGTLLWTSD